MGLLLLSFYCNRKIRTVKKTIHREEYQKLLKALEQARTDKGMTQQEIADALGKPQSYISKIENGERRIDVIEFMEICEVIGVKYEKLLKEAGR